VTAPRLTVVGHCTSTTARILCCVDQGVGVRSRIARLAWRAGAASGWVETQLSRAPPYELGVLELRELPPAAQVVYGIGERILEAGTRTFRLLPAERPPRVAGCNGVFEREIEAGSVDLIVHAGDRFWTAPDVAAVLTSCPSIMTWDDHDIDEGWGSNPNDDKPWRRLFFRAARQAFSEFQASIGCPRIDEGSFACGFTHGDLAFLLLDGRSHRLYKEGRVLGDAQFEAARKWLQALPASTRRVYLVLGIPPIHAKLTTVAAILRWTPFSEPYASDLRDGWASKGNRGECEKLMRLLVEFCATHRATDITVLSGDVHVANIGRLEHAATGVIWQATSSGCLMENVSRPAIHLSAGVRGKLVPITEHGHDLMHRRNFALLQLDGADGWHAAAALRVRLFGEALPEPRELLLPSRAPR